MVVMASNGPSPHFPSLHLGVPTPQPSRRHHAQSLLGASLHDPRTHHVFKSHHEQFAPLSRRDDERRHLVGSYSSLALRLYLAACNPFWSVEIEKELYIWVGLLNNLTISNVLSCLWFV